MTRSSPARRSQVLSSPDRSFLSDYLSENRNNETSHMDALAAARIEHERLREAAIRVFELHELQEEHKRIVEQERKEQERLKMEADIAAEEKRLRELRAKSIPRPPPEPEPEPEPAPAPAKQTMLKSATKEQTQANPINAPQKVQTEQAPPATITPSSVAQSTQHNGLFTSQTTQKPSVQPPLGSAIQGKERQPSAPLQTTTSAPAPSSAATATALAPKPVATAQSTTSSRRMAHADRLSQIHQTLKKLRQNLVAESKRPGSPLKGKLGAFRRDIRTAIGQLTHVKGANAQPTNKITATLNESLQGAVPSPLVPVSEYVVDVRQPAEGATHNGDQLPALFLYLMNICAKGIISQFINECGANPKAADPIGVFTAHIFSHKDFQWRGKPLMDILMAKFRVVCPALFGFRGNDRTERGRVALGWRKEETTWITEQAHNDRMAGLGAGFASISLRDFSKSAKQNPYPPTNYWMAFADIINSKPGEVSNTQFVVLRGMIEGHEQRFLTFFGNAALQALRLALVEFPKKAPANATAAGSLLALAEVLKNDGLALD